MRDRAKDFFVKAFIPLLPTLVLGMFWIVAEIRLHRAMIQHAKEVEEMLAGWNETMHHAKVAQSIALELKSELEDCRRTQARHLVGYEQ